jgi:hypothetical protein
VTSEFFGRRDGATLILRLWRDGGDAEPWRYSVEDPLSRQRRGFSSLDELVPFLHALTAARTSGAAVEARGADRIPNETREEQPRGGGDSARTTDYLAGAGNRNVARGDDPRPGSRPAARLQGRDGMGPVGDR